MIRGKLGQELSTNTIIIIILAVVVLVVLAVGFTIGWQKILPFTSQTNVDTIKTACETACSTTSTFEFCSVQREVRDGTNEKFMDSCYNLTTTKYTGRNYGITACNSVTCSP